MKTAYNWLLGFILTGASAFGVKSCHDRVGTEVFRGTLDGYDVTYEEGRINWGHRNGFGENHLRLEKDGKTYDLFDLVEETSIDWESETPPDFGKDHLEKIVITTPEGSIKYFLPWRGDINVNTLDGKHAAEIFKNANTRYNKFRSDIRNLLRAKRTAALDLIKGDF